MSDEYTIIGRALFKKETNIQLFTGLKVQLSTGETGTLEGAFGQSGKFKVRINGEDKQGNKLALAWHGTVLLFSFGYNFRWSTTPTPTPTSLSLSLSLSLFLSWSPTCMHSVSVLFHSLVLSLSLSLSLSFTHVFFFSFRLFPKGGLKPETVQQLSASQKKKGKGKGV